MVLKLYFTIIQTLRMKNNLGGDRTKSRPLPSCKR